MKEKNTEIIDDKKALDMAVAYSNEHANLSLYKKMVEFAKIYSRERIEHALRSQAETVEHYTNEINKIKVFNLEEEQLFKRVLDTWGERNQILMIQEEAIELSMAIHKFLHRDSYSIENVYGEIADMKIMLSQAERIFDKSQIEKIRQYKMARLRKRLDIFESKDITEKNQK